MTIKTIASDLGISHMTVSRALSGHPSVSPETRKTVTARAHQLGYVKSAAAMAVRGEGTRIVGLILPNISNEFYAGFANDLTSRCNDSGFDPIIHLTDDEEVKEQTALRRLLELQARAVVMVPAPRDDTLQDRLALTGLEVIQIIRSRPEPHPTTRLEIDDTAALRQAVTHLAARGCRRIAYIGATDELSSGHSRRAAYLAGLDMAGLNRDTALMRSAAPSFEMGRKSAMSLIDTARPDALICGGFEISNGALDMLLERAIAMPGAIAFVGYGDPAFYRYINGGVSTISLPVQSLTEDAVALVARAITGVSPTNLTSRKASLVLRGTA